jgi:hypothetical protein
MNTRLSLREFMKDMDPVFHFTQEHEVYTLPMIEIYDNAVIIAAPPSPFPEKNITGFITSRNGMSIVEVKAHVIEHLPERSEPGTLRLEIDTANVERLNSRLYPRFRFSPPLDGSARLAGAKATQPVKILDFSAGGLCCESPAELPADHTIEFNFQLEIQGEAHNIALEGTVLNKRSSPATHTYSVKFCKQGYDSTEFDAVQARETAKRTIYLVNLVNKLIRIEGGEWH